MKIEEVRSSFTVFLISSQPEKLHEVSKALGSAGYMVAHFAELGEAFSEFSSNPPHFVVFHFHEDKFNMPQAVQQVQLQLPESHVLVCCGVEDRVRASSFLERGVYDLVLLPAVKTQEIVVRFDHAAERDYFMYLNERLMDAQASSDAAQDSAQNSQPPISFMRELFAKSSLNECIQVFLEATSRQLADCPAVYFKFFGNRRMLVAAQSHRLQDVDMQGLGVDFNQHSTSFRVSHLRDPEDLPEIRALCDEVFHMREFLALPVEVLGEVQGVVIFLIVGASVQQRASVRDSLQLLEKVIGLFEAQKRLHSTSVKDLSTDVYNRTHFLARSLEEVARARRTNLPISMIVLTLDQLAALRTNFGVDESNIVLRMIVKIIEKHSRINDVIGRLSSDEFAMVLPHTTVKGALIKAERLRRIVESADFSKVLGTLPATMPSLSISVGVSEYPSLCRDADELLQSCDEALFHVRSETNKVCVAKAPEGFVADFEVKGV